MIEIWYIWAAVALIFIIIEVFTTGFAVFCFAIGALGAALMAAFGCSVVLQVVGFAVLSFLSFVIARPLLLKKTARSDVRLSGVDALPGRKALVVKSIEGTKGGLVALDGDVWKAVVKDERVIGVDESVTVVGVCDSVVLVVE